VARYFWIDPRYKSRIFIASMNDKSSINPQSLHAMRHSCSHLMATAIHQLWPQA
jgi:threonyl-tRNA synthetase